MKTYTTDEGLEYCSNCGTYLGEAPIKYPSCGTCWQIENGDMSDNEEDFECCNDCDLPDACSDFGCAIKQGIRKPPIGYGGIF